MTEAGQDMAGGNGPRMDARAVVGLGATGAIPATLTLFGLYGPAGELLVWTVLAALVWIPVSWRRGIERRVVHMVLVGLVAGVVTGLIQGSFAHVLFANVPEQAIQFGGAATALVRLQIFAIGVGIGVVWGLAVGLVWQAIAMAGKLLARRRGPADA